MIDEQTKYQYVVGFYFNECRDSVVLIRKNKPAEQAGKLNGIGGKVEPGEAPVEAMAREFCEETGRITRLADWRFFAVLRLNQCDIHFFETSGKEHGILTGLSSPTDERVAWYHLRNPARFELADALPNLRWLIPLALANEQSVSIEQ